MADTFGWEWVFLGVVALVVPALAMVTPALSGMGEKPSPDAPPWSVSRIVLAVFAALAVLVLNLSAGFAGWLVWAVPVAAIVLLAVTVRPLLPPGTLRAAKGLPSVVLLRGLVAGSFFGAEIYIPYLLSDHYGLSASMAGLALTLGGVMWGIALLLSPLIGFAFAALLLLALRAFVKNRSLYKAPKGDTPPPWWIRGMLIATCTGVSFAHGSNDGQKGNGRYPCRRRPGGRSRPG